MENEDHSDDSALHQELLEEAEPHFPIESFLVMRRAGLSVQECLEALDVRETELSFQQRAVLTLNPEDEDQIKALLGHSG